MASDILILLLCGICTVLFYICMRLSARIKNIRKQHGCGTDKLVDANLNLLERKELLEEQNQLLEEQKFQLAEANLNILELKEKVEAEKERSDRLLLNILPVRVAQDLKDFGRTEPKVFDDVTVCFVDIVGFTRKSAEIDPATLISELNEVFTAFDNIVEKYQCERIKTIGDAYLALCGMPQPNEKHAERIVKSAIEMLVYLQDRNMTSDINWRVRIGVHSGKVVGGVVGIKKYIYDVFGDTINTASRMESASEPMRINVSQETHSLLKDKFLFIERSPIEVKGKGFVTMYFLEREQKN